MQSLEFGQRFGPKFGTGGSVREGYGGMESWSMGEGGGGRFLVACVSLMLTGVLGVEKMLLVLGTSRVVRWVFTFTVDAFWESTSEFKAIFGSVGLVTFNTL